MSEARDVLRSVRAYAMHATLCGGLDHSYEFCVVHRPDEWEAMAQATLDADAAHPVELLAFTTEPKECPNCLDGFKATEVEGKGWLARPCPVCGGVCSLCGGSGYNPAPDGRFLCPKCGGHGVGRGSVKVDVLDLLGYEQVRFKVLDPRVIGPVFAAKDGTP